MLHAVNDFITSLAGQPWVYLALFALCLIDAFFPPLPSESVLVSLAVLSVQGEPNVWLVGVLAASGAFIGDNIAYQIGRTVGVERFWWQRLGRVQRATVWARRQLRRRGAVLIVAGRYVPVGRIAVNMTAGATGYRRRRFMVFDAIAGCAWAAWSIAIGRLAGHWIQDNPVLGAAVAIGIAVVLGIVADHLVRRFTTPSDEVELDEVELEDGPDAADDAAPGSSHPPAQPSETVPKDPPRGE
ncbi:MAG TPA: DedA family protein [Segeticoccus sp.]|nr:DedA family protein [Segeticoccus sp.]